MKEKIEQLSKQLNIYNYYYYSKNESLISDQRFDELMKELEALEGQHPEFTMPDSPTKKVGSSLINTKFAKVKHLFPMLSLENSYNAKDTERFFAKKPGAEITLEYKLDGLSIELEYRGGKLVQGLTRGDGETGEDVTENVMQIENVPHYLKTPIDAIVRGEILMPKSVFEKLNAERLAEGKEPFANPRNAASGAMRQLDHEEVKRRGLVCYIYQMVTDKFDHSESIEIVKTLGLPTMGVERVLKSSSELMQMIESYRFQSKKLDVETDGLVLKYDSVEIQKELGIRSKYPAWATAYKFPAERVSTKLLDVTWQVGRTGKLTPVAELKEVELAGTKVRRASLHNMDEVNRLGIKIGDEVMVEKAAEIIPQVVGVANSVEGNTNVITLPKSCPVCGGAIAQEEGQVDYRCQNPSCGAKLQAYIEYFVGRDAMNIMGLGGKAIEQLIEAGFLTRIEDLYLLKNRREELLKLERMGEKSIDNLLEEIEKSKKQPFQRVLYALGITYVGRTVSKQLTQRFNSLVEICQTPKSVIMEMEGIGEKIADSLYTYLRSEENQRRIMRLKKLGLSFENKPEEKEAEVTSPASEKLNGKTFLATGKLEHFTRNGIEESIRLNGGINASAVSKSLNYLIAGEKAGSKLTKAEALGTVIILSEEEYLDLIK